MAVASTPETVCKHCGKTQAEHIAGRCPYASTSFEPGRPDHDLPGRPKPDHDLPEPRPGGRPDHDLPERERPQPKR
jgi:hypothetical protein